MIEWTVRIEVTEHAVKRANERLGYGDVTSIRMEIRDALMFDRVSASRPNWTRGSGQEAGLDERGYILYVWDRAATHAWVLSPNEKETMVSVKTLLLDYDDHRDSADQLKLRSGTRRAS